MERAKELLKEQVQNALSVLTERERQVLEMRFGLNGHQESTLEEIAQKYELTRARIHQVLNTTLNKCRSLV